MNACCRAAIADHHFGSAKARSQVEAYRAHGPDRITRLALALLRALPISSARLLDVGGGIGVIGRELLREERVSTVTMVEESSAYLAAARALAEEDRTTDRHTFVAGDFVGVAAGVGPADVVTLHRVVCCYPDYTALLDAAAASGARSALLSYPRDRWYVRAVLSTENLLCRVRGDPFRSYVHPEPGIRNRMKANGFRRVSDAATPFWRLEVYAK
ncbi:MAG TPA: methyltransferase domain-containing protein [Longimicrobiales bacterium]|nr:methyltransferase domain-containing protein [Longimicrobiales bacterium]